MPAHRVYVGTIGEGLWRSLDGGETFVRAMDGMFVECHVRALVAHPRDPRILYLGAELGLFVSRDGADHWQQVDSPLNGKQIWSILIAPHDPNVILVGACPARIFRSADGGATWAETRTAMLQDCPRIMWTRVTTLLQDPGDPSVLWAGVEIDGIHRSTDGGLSWQKVGSGLSSLDIHALARVPGNGAAGVFLAATNNDMNRSEDGGVTWRQLRIKDTLPWPYCRTLAQPVGKPEVILLGNGNGPPGSTGLVARSEDAGLTWSAAHMPQEANSTIWNFAVNTADINLIYASSVSGQVYRSHDQGKHWEKLPREFGEIRALAWAPS